MNTKTFDSIEELMKYITQENWRDYIFRGQSNENWLLESTLSRKLREISKITQQEKEKLIEKHYSLFNSNIRGKLKFIPKTLSDDERLALGQHYGLITPLLDFTTSPYIAIFFAFITEPLTEPVTDYRIVWCIDKKGITLINEKHCGKGKPNLKEMTPEVIDINKRIIAQSALFYKMPDDTIDIETWINEMAQEEKEKQIITKMRISNELKKEILEMLDQMNINYNSMYPDLIGASLDCNIRFNKGPNIIAKTE